MLFMYIHTHTVDKCLIDNPQETAKILSGAQEAAKKGAFKIIGMYAAPHEHTSYTILDATDLAVVERALVPMTKWGDARLIPVIATEQLPS